MSAKVFRVLLTTLTPFTAQSFLSHEWICSLSSSRQLIGRRSCQMVAKRITDRTTEKAHLSDRPNFNWNEHWYPLAFEKFTTKDLPVGMSVLGQPLALFWDHKAQKWCITEDRCPHRLAPLSEGRVDEAGHIQCPYHGWSFDGGTGTCMGIPQADPGSGLNPKCDVRSFPCVARDGLIWGWIQANPGRRPARVSEIDDKHIRAGEWPPESLVPKADAFLEDPRTVSFDFSRDVPMDYVTLMENTVDASHVPFAHHGNAGKRDDAGPMPFKLQATPSEDGFSGYWDMRGAEPSTAERYTNFTAPHTSIVGVKQKGVEARFFFSATPSSPGRSRVLARFAFRFGEEGKKIPLPLKLARLFIALTPDWMQHMNQNTIIDDDGIFLHHQERSIASSHGDWRSIFWMPTQSDLYIAQFRSWLQRYGGGGPFGVIDYDPAWPRDKLLDRYEQHTKHCTACSGALRTIDNLVPKLAVVGAMTGIFALRGDVRVFRLPMVAGITSLLSWLLRAKCIRWRSLLVKGPYPPKRNQLGH